MDSSFEYLARNLASHLIDLRIKRKLTQSQLAKMADIPRSTLANLESGMGNPSLQNLAKVCEALRVPIEELLSTPRSPTKLIRKEEIPVIKRGGGKVSVYKLLPDPLPGTAIDRMELSPKTRMGGVPHASGTKEYFHCVEGEITLNISGQDFDLHPGDVLAFPGDSAHAYVNRGTTHALGFSVVVRTPVDI